MMAQHVGYSFGPASFILLLGVFHLANGILFENDVDVVTSKSINSICLIDRNVVFNNNNNNNSNNTLYSVKTDDKTIVGRLLVQVEFAELKSNNDVALSWSSNDRDCDDNGHSRLRKLTTSSASRNIAIYELPDDCCFEVIEVYFCSKAISRHDVSWHNLGGNFTVKPRYNESHARRARDNGRVAVTSDGPASRSYESVRIEGLRVERSGKEATYSDEGIPEILTESPVTLRLFGTGITNDTIITFTDIPQERGTICDKIKTREFPVKSVEIYTAMIDVVLPLGSPFFLCVKQGIYGENQAKNSQQLFKHQGIESYKMIRTYQNTLPLWLSILIILTCLGFSALFSGLNLGLMAMDRTELKILCNTGTEQEKKYARTIEPVRNRGNYLLCSILFSNVLVNSLFTILLDGLTSGVVAVICSTLAIVIFGEISPQAFCSRHGLCVGAKTIWVTKFTMVATFPLSYPISKILNLLLGEEIGNVYNRERLKELVKVTTGYNDLEKDEVNIISGALELRKKTVADVMTRIEDVYMLDYNAVLDFETVSEIMKSGYSRIPVYEGARTNIITMLYIKDLAFVDPDDNTPLRTLCQFYQNPCNFVFEDVTLDIMFKQFKEGQKGHMAFVQRVNNEGEGDPFYEVIGLVTLEDVIEELIQAEIMDETDVFTDNRSKRKRLARPRAMQDFTVFAEKKENQRIHISPQLTLAMFQYLSTIDPFKADTISETILRRLLKQDIIYHIKVKSREKAKSDPAALIYQQGKPVDYFVLILEGRVQVTVGKENLAFESGPFTYFGQQALISNVVIADSPTNANPQTLGSIQSVNLDAIMRHTFVPDYTVRAITEVFYVKIKRSLYLAARRATLLDKSQKDPSQDQFDDEVEKLLHSLDEDDRSVLESPILSRKGHDKDSELQHSPRKSVTAPTSPVPVSASPVTNAKFISTRTGHNGKLKTSPLNFVCGFVLLWTLTLISMDRHRCLAVAPYRSALTGPRVLAASLITWIIGSLIFLPAAFWFRPKDVIGGVTICTLVFPRNDLVNISLCFTIPIIIVACLLPMILLVYHYQRIFQRILDTRSRWAVSCVSQAQDSGTGGRRDSELSVVGTLVPWAGRKLSSSSVTGRQGRTGSLSQHEEIRLHKHLRVVRILLLNVVAVLVMWLPITTVMLLIYIDGRRPNEDTDFFLKSHHFIWALITAQLNTVINPLLYGVFSENFRACFAKLWRRTVNATKRKNGTTGSGGGERASGGGGATGSSTRKSARSLEALRGRLQGKTRISGGSVKKPTRSSKKSSSCSIAGIIEVPGSEKP